MPWCRANRISASAAAVVTHVFCGLCAARQRDLKRLGLAHHDKHCGRLVHPCEQIRNNVLCNLCIHRVRRVAVNLEGLIPIADGNRNRTRYIGRQRPPAINHPQLDGVNRLHIIHRRSRDGWKHLRSRGLSGPRNTSTRIGVTAPKRHSEPDLVAVAQADHSRTPPPAIPPTPDMVQFGRRTRQDGGQAASRGDSALGTHRRCGRI
jgi:hypothetical protein